MKKVLATVLIFMFYFSLVGITSSALVFDDGGGGGSAPQIIDYEGNTYSTAKQVSMNSSTSATFSSYSDDDYFVYTAPYSGRTRIYTTGFSQTKVTLSTLEVYSATTYYGEYLQTIESANDYEDHISKYSNTLIKDASKERAYDSNIYGQHNNGYVTFNAEKGETYYIKVEKTYYSASDYYSLKINEDAYCVNQNTDPRYSQDTYTKLMINGAVIFSDNFDSIDGAGKIDYLDLTNYNSEVEHAIDTWNSMSTGQIFYEWNSSKVLDLVIMDTAFIYNYISSFSIGAGGVYISAGIYTTTFQPVEEVTGEWYLDNIDLIRWAILYMRSTNVLPNFSTDLSIIVIDTANVSSSTDAESTILHELGHALGFGDMYNTVGPYSDLEGSMNAMGSNSVIQTGFCDLKIYNDLFN